MPSGFAVALGGVCLELQNRSRLNLCDFGQKRQGGRFGLMQDAVQWSTFESGGNIQYSGQKNLVSDVRFSYCNKKPILSLLKSAANLQP